MMRWFVYVLCCVVYASALDIGAEKTPVYKEIQVATHLNTINEVIKQQDEFLTVKHFIRLFRHQSNKQIWLKIPLENFTNKAVQRAFISKWERVDFDIYIVKDNTLAFSQSISNEHYLKQSDSFNIPANSQVDFYVHVKTKRSLSQFFYMYFVQAEHANSFIINNEKLYHHGLFFGILLTMTMYSFFMYFSIKEKGYLFLGFYQMSVLIATSDFRHYFFELLEGVPSFADFLLRGVFGYIIMFLSILFTKEFLNTKKEMPRFNLFLNILMIFILPINAIDSSIDYAAFLYIIYVFTGIYVFWHKRNILVLFYILGFVGFPVYLILSNMAIFFDGNFYFEYDYAKQIFTCVESFTLTMALYLKLRTIMNERQKAKDEATHNEKLMLEQSRFASMGEMLASIAHQWRQPLNHLNMIMANLQLASENNKLTPVYLNKKANEVDRQLKYMSATIEDFSNFFATKGKKEQFVLEEIGDYTLGLLHSRLKKHSVMVSLINNDTRTYENYKNELIQVLCIVMNNAIDALISNEVAQKKIELRMNCNEILVQDNGGGIKETVLPRIFDPYFSTKDKRFGTGLGLYMAKIIVTNLNGRIEVQNTQEGARFKIRLD